MVRNGVRYLMTLIDNFSKKVWMYFLREKSEIFLKLKVLKVEVEKEQGCNVKCL